MLIMHKGMPSWFHTTKWKTKCLANNLERDIILILSLRLVSCDAVPNSLWCSKRMPTQLVANVVLLSVPSVQNLILMPLQWRCLNCDLSSLLKQMVRLDAVVERVTQTHFGVNKVCDLECFSLNPCSLFLSYNVGTS